MRKAREVTSKILEAVEDGTINRDLLIRDALMWMSEDDVAEMAKHHEFFPEEDEEEEGEEWTPDNADFGDPGSRHHY